MDILYDQNSLPGLRDFGIEIPFLDERLKNIISYFDKNDINYLVRDEQVYWPAVTRQDLENTHLKDYIDKLFQNSESITAAVQQTYELINVKGEFHRYNPDNAKKNVIELRDRVLRQVEGTYHACEKAIDNNLSYFLGGGLHHAMSFGGRGFCLLNDIVIAARMIQKKKNLKNIWIIDVDAHKGDGTAELTQNDPTIETLSIHMAKGWPLEFDSEKNEPWYIESTIDIPVFKDGEYLSLLEEGLKLLSKKEKPSLAIIVQGSDPYEKDGLESSKHLSLSLDQLKERDQMVYEFLKSLNIPQAYVMSGGYGEHAHEPYIEFFKYLKQRGEL